MSALFFAAAVILAVLAAVGYAVRNALYWVLAAMAAGLFAWVVGAPGWMWPRRRD